MPQDAFDRALASTRQPTQAQRDPFDNALAQVRSRAVRPVDMAEEEARSAERAARSPTAVRDVVRASLQGLPFVGTFSEEAEAAVTGKPLAQIRQEMAEARARSGGGMFMAELGTGLLTGGAATAGAKRIGSAGLRRALESGLLQGAAAGAGSAEGGPMSRIVGGAIGAAGGELASKVLTPTPRITSRDVPRDVAGATAGMGQSTRLAALASLRNRIAGAGTTAQRFASDVLTTQGAQRTGRVGRALEAAGRAIEPVDAVKAERSLARIFPGSVPMAALEEQAGRAKVSAKGLEEQVTAARAAVQESAAKTKARADQLLQESQQRAETTLQQLQAEAENLVGPLRNPKESASALRQATRERQEAAANASYPVVAAMRPNPVYPKAIYQRINADRGLRADFAEVVAEKRRDLLSKRLNAPDVDPMTGVPGVRMPTYKTGRMVRNPATGEVIEETVPQLDLDMLDRMRRKTLDKMDQFLSNSNTGISRSEGNRRLAQIKKLEEDFYKTVPAEQREAMIAARQPYAQEFDNLQALADGQNIFRFTVGAKEQVLGAGKNDLRELLQEFSEVRRQAASAGTQEARQAAAARLAHFEVGVRQAIADMAASTSDDALAVIQRLVGTTEARMRSGTVFSPKFMEQMQALLPEQAQRTAAAFAGPTARKAALLAERAKVGGGKRTQALQQEAERLATALTQQQGRAESLDRLTAAAGRLRSAVETTPTGREAAEGFLNVDLPLLGNRGQQALRQYAEGLVKRQMQGLTLEQARQRLAQYRNNPALRALLETELEAMERSITPGPRIVRPELARLVGGRAGGLAGAFFSPGQGLPQEEQP